MFDFVAIDNIALTLLQCCWCRQGLMQHRRDKHMRGFSYSDCCTAVRCNNRKWSHVITCLTVTAGHWEVAIHDTYCISRTALSSSSQQKWTWRVRCGNIVLRFLSNDCVRDSCQLTSIFIARLLGAATPADYMHVILQITVTPARHRCIS